MPFIYQNGNFLYPLVCRYCELEKGTPFGQNQYGEYAPRARSSLAVRKPQRCFSAVKDFK